MQPVPALIAALETQSTLGSDLRPWQLSFPSACSGWTVREVLNHSLGVTMKFVDFAVGATDRPRTPTGDLVGADHAAALDRALGAARSAWASADMNRLCHLAFGTFSAETAAGINLFDVLAHSWDIATSIELELDCSDELWSAGLSSARAVIGADRDLRHYSTEVPIGPHESVRSQFLGFLGRIDVDRRATR